MAEGRMIKGWKVHESPVPRKLNKFVITENQAWFLAMEDRSELTFADIFPELLDSPADDDKVADGRILFGYVDKETREVSVHNWFPDSNDSHYVDIEVVKRRLREIFPHAEYFESSGGEKHQL